MSKVTLILGILILVYLGLMIYAYFYSNSVIFVPPSSQYADSADLLKIKTPSGATLAAIYLPIKDSKYVILFNHGNATDLGLLYPFLNALNHHGYSAFAYDYEGYGRSTGTPSEKHAYEDSLAAYDYLTRELKIPAGKIIVYGHSLGAAMAIYIALHREVAGVILESPFITAFRVRTHIPVLPFDRFNNLKLIQQIQAPLLIMHGREDDVIPFWHGEMLYRMAHQPKRFFAVDDAGHSDILEKAGDEFWRQIQNFISVS